MHRKPQDKERLLRSRGGVLLVNRSSKLYPTFAIWFVSAPVRPTGWAGCDPGGAPRRRSEPPEGFGDGLETAFAVVVGTHS
jgi:hypothetical protein